MTILKKTELDFVSIHTGITKLRLRFKYVREASDVRALVAFILKNYCQIKTYEICSILNGASSTNVSKLFYVVLKLVK